MSLYKLEEITCPCGEIFEAELWNSIDITKDPELKEALVSGEINVVCCPACRQIFYAEHFILYHDSQNELLAFVYPLDFAHQRDYWQKKMEEDFLKAMDNFSHREKISYKPLLLFGLDSLTELIKNDDEITDESKILEYSADDIGIEYIKIYPSKAREYCLPRVIPVSRKKHGTFRNDVLAGLKLILAKNPNLEVYERFLKKIEKNSDWELDEHLVVKDKNLSKCGVNKNRQKC